MPDKTTSKKLGYLRSSVACVHCRKRKIRCVREARTGECTTRCVSCTRLGKDCHFCSDEQQKTVERILKPRIRHDGENQSYSAVSQRYPFGVSLQPAPTDSTPYNDGYAWRMEEDRHASFGMAESLAPEDSCKMIFNRYLNQCTKQNNEYFPGHNFDLNASADFKNAPVREIETARGNEANYHSYTIKSRHESFVCAPLLKSVESQSLNINDQNFRGEYDSSFGVEDLYRERFPDASFWEYA